MSEQNNNLNVFNLKFLNFNYDNDSYKINFKGISENYEKSFIYGDFSLNLLNDTETDTYNYVINVYVNTLNFTISGVVKNNSTYNNHSDLVREMWKLIFLNGRKNSNGMNTLQNNSTEKYQYMCYLNSKLFDNDNDKIYIFIENYEWPNNLISENNTTSPSTSEPTSAPTQTSCEPEVEVLKNFIPEELNEIAFYNWEYNVAESTPENEVWYLNTFIFYTNKIIEVDYVNSDLSEYKNYFEYNKGDNFDYFKKENKLEIEINYPEPQYLITNNNQGVYTSKLFTFEFKDNGNMLRTIKYRKMDAAELTIYKPVLETNNFTVNIEEGNSYVISPVITYERNIPKFPGEISVDLQDGKVQCLNKNSINSVSIRPSQSQNVYLFNNVPYASNQYIGVIKGVYTLDNVPKEHPIGFAINDLSKFEVIEGVEVDVKLVDGLFIMHYTGRVRFEVLGDFGIISYNCYNHGYMGGKSRLKYTEKC